MLKFYEKDTDMYFDDWDVISKNFWDSYFDEVLILFNDNIDSFDELRKSVEEVNSLLEKREKGKVKLKVASNHTITLYYYQNGEIKHFISAKVKEI
jgi:hypothetical protein